MIWVSPVLCCDHECVAQITDAHHLPGSPQRWPTVEPDVRQWVDSILADISMVLGDSLVGVYLHGSLAMGCYYRPKSDLDLLIVCQDPVAPGLREDMARVLLGASDRGPTTGDIEASVMQLAHTKEFVHPSPFEVHFGSEHAEAIRHGRVNYITTDTDSDLAAHCKVVRSRGVRLLGEEIENVFGSVPEEAYVSSIRADLDWILQGDNILTSPYYGVLNGCRVLMVLDQGPHLVPSKEEAAQWALTWVPEQHRDLITQSLKCYRSSAPVTEVERRTHGHHWDHHRLFAFRDWIRSL